MITNSKNFIIIAIFLLSLFSLVPAKGFGEGQVHIVDIPEKTRVFMPDIIRVNVGDTVKWVNNDHSIKQHEFMSVPGPNPENKEIKMVLLTPDQIFEHTFNKKGEYSYICFIHKGMVGKVIVK